MFFSFITFPLIWYLKRFKRLLENLVKYLCSPLQREKNGDGDLQEMISLHFNPCVGSEHADMSTQWKMLSSSTKKSLYTDVKHSVCRTQTSAGVRECHYLTSWGASLHDVVGWKWDWLERTFFFLQSLAAVQLQVVCNSNLQTDIKDGRFILCRV